jgi:hypothetical protein
VLKRVGLMAHKDKFHEPALGRPATARTQDFLNKILSL